MASSMRKHELAGGNDIAYGSLGGAAEALARRQARMNNARAGRRPPSSDNPDDFKVIKRYGRRHTRRNPPVAAVSSALCASSGISSVVCIRSSLLRLFWRWSILVVVYFGGGRCGLYLHAHVAVVWGAGVVCLVWLLTQSLLFFSLCVCCVCLSLCVFCVCNDNTDTVCCVLQQQT